MMTIKITYKTIQTAQLIKVKTAHKTILFKIHKLCYFPNLELPLKSKTILFKINFFIIFFRKSPIRVRQTANPRTSSRSRTPKRRLPDRRPPMLQASLRPKHRKIWLEFPGNEQPRNRVVHQVRPYLAVRSEDRSLEEADRHLKLHGHLLGILPSGRSKVSREIKIAKTIIHA